MPQTSFEGASAKDTVEYIAKLSPHCAFSWSTAPPGSTALEADALPPRGSRTTQACAQTDNNDNSKDKEEEEEEEKEEENVDDDDDNDDNDDDNNDDNDNSNNDNIERSNSSYFFSV